MDPGSKALVRGVWVAELGLGVPREGPKALVRTVGSKGRAKNHAQWVTSYRLSYSLDGIKWIYYQHDGSIVTFKGNVDADTEVRNDLPAPVTARYIRFNPVTWYGHITMRVEVYGIYTE